MRNQPLGAVGYGIDPGKTCFDVVGCDASGRADPTAEALRDTLFSPTFADFQPQGPRHEIVSASEIYAINATLRR